MLALCTCTQNRQKNRRLRRALRNTTLWPNETYMQHMIYAKNHVFKLHRLWQQITCLVHISVVERNLKIGFKAFKSTTLMIYIGIEFIGWVNKNPKLILKNSISTWKVIHIFSNGREKKSSKNKGGVVGINYPDRTYP